MKWLFSIYQTLLLYIQVVDMHLLCLDNNMYSLIKELSKNCVSSYIIEWCQWKITSQWNSPAEAWILLAAMLACYQQLNWSDAIECTNNNTFISMVTMSKADQSTISLQQTTVYFIAPANDQMYLLKPGNSSRCWCNTACTISKLQLHGKMNNQYMA